MLDHQTLRLAICVVRKLKILDLETNLASLQEEIQREV